MPKAKKPLISLVVLNWNGKKFIDPFMGSVLKQTKHGYDLEVLFVDNKSSDDSVEYYKNAYYDDVQYRLVQNNGNYGYAKGNNLGIKQAKGEYVLVCNNDLVLADNLIDSLLSTSLKFRADLVVPKLMFLNKQGYINNAGSTLQPGSNWPIAERGANERDDGQYDAIVEITAFCGACVLFKRSFLEEVGLYDNKFFMYFEDGDLSWRGQKAEKKFYYDPNAIAQHYHTGSSKEGSPLFNHFVARNRVLILTKNAGFRVLASGWKATLREHLTKRLINLARALVHRYSKKQAVLELLRSLKTISAIILLTPYCLLKRYKIVKEDKL